MKLDRNWIYNKIEIECEIDWHVENEKKYKTDSEIECMPQPEIESKVDMHPSLKQSSK